MVDFHPARRNVFGCLTAACTHDLTQHGIQPQRRHGAGFQRTLRLRNCCCFFGAAHACLQRKFAHRGKLAADKVHFIVKAKKICKARCAGVGQNIAQAASVNGKAHQRPQIVAMLRRSGTGGQRKAQLDALHGLFLPRAILRHDAQHLALGPGPATVEGIGFAAALVHGGKAKILLTRGQKSAVARHASRLGRGKKILRTAHHQLFFLTAGRHKAALCLCSRIRRIRHWFPVHLKDRP